MSEFRVYFFSCWDRSLSQYAVNVCICHVYKVKIKYILQLAGQEIFVHPPAEPVCLYYCRQKWHASVSRANRQIDGDRLASVGWSCRYQWWRQANAQRKRRQECLWTEVFQRRNSWSQVGPGHLWGVGCKVLVFHCKYVIRLEVPQLVLLLYLSLIIVIIQRNPLAEQWANVVSAAGAVRGHHWFRHIGPCAACMIICTSAKQLPLTTQEYYLWDTYCVIIHVNVSSDSRGTCWISYWWLDSISRLLDTEFCVIPRFRFTPRHLIFLSMPKRATKRLMRPLQIQIVFPSTCSRASSLR